MTRARRYLIGAAALAVLLASIIAHVGATLAVSLALAVPASEPWLAPFAAAPVREATRVPGAGRSLEADLYRPPAARSALLLVHGLSRTGRRHPELVRLARLVAARGHLVLVPQIEGLTAFRLGDREIEEIDAALRHLGASGARVGIAGFSFGAGPALLAAARHPDLRLVGSFGGYADLRHVISYVTTGAHTFEGRRYVRSQEEYNRWKLLALLEGFVDDARDAALVQSIAARKLADPSDDTRALEAALGEEGRIVLALVRNRQEDGVAALLARLPARARRALDDLSPLAVVSRLTGRLLIAHGAHDDSIPFTESLRLAEAARGRARVAILETFHHTGPQPLWRSLGQGARDGWSLLRLVDDLLGA